LYAPLYNPKTIEKKYSKITITNNQRKSANEWIKKLKNNELEKEKKNYFVFRDVVLRDLLGYPEEKILYEEKNVEFSIQDEHGDTGVCFEAKGTKTKLFVRQGYEKKEQENPVVQTLSNMKRFPASYGVCTNYRNFVLLDSKKKLSKCHRFDFLSIENSDKKLKEFIGIFSYKNLVIEKTLEDLYNSSVSEEREFTKEFYKLFHETRLMLIKAFQEKEKVTMDEAIHYAQLYLNRLIFIFFAEDKGDIEERLFSKRVLKILEAGQCTESTRSVSDDILKLFKYLEKGSDVQGIFGFNGGLFKERITPKIYFFDLKNPEFFSEVKQHSKLSKKIKLDELSSKIVKKYENKLSPIISNLLIMDSFDFTSEVNVNILGRIFEQSISDLEELRIGGTSRRKKEGVFYTPEFITEYICINTIIPYLSKKNASTIDDLIGEYLENPEELESKIREIKILDPACGSGAFLVKAVEILLDIDKEIQSIKPQTGGQLQLEEWSNEKEITKIIEKNIFGVDINEESVEITRLSLFLKMAIVNRKLIDLSKNIRVGNSIVDFKNIDSKAFDWQNEFKDVMINGGFDIIIGNPPYIRVQRIRHEMTDFIFENYKSAHKKFDISIIFLEKALNLIKSDGLIGFISSSQWLNTDYGEKIRELVKGKINEIIDFGSLPVFEDVHTYPAIFFLQNKNLENLKYKKIRNVKDLTYDGIESSSSVIFSQKDLEPQRWHLGSFNLLNHLNKNKIPWELLTTLGHFFYGAISGQDDVFIVNDEIIKSKKLEEKFLFPYAYRGEDVERFSEIFPAEKIIYPYYPDSQGNAVLLTEEELKQKAPNIHCHLKDHKEKLSKRKDSRKFYAKGKNWFKLVRQGRFKLILPKKLVVKGIEKDAVVGFLAENTVFSGANTPAFIIEKDEVDWKYLISILNSKVVTIYLQGICPAKLHGYFRFNANNLNTIPIPSEVHENLKKKIIKNSEDIIKFQQDFNDKKQKFFRRIIDNLNIEKITKKIKNFPNLSFQEFLTIVNLKSNDKLSLKDQDEWENYYDRYQKDLLFLQDNIKKTNNAQTELIYEIYKIDGVSREIIEESLGTTNLSDIYHSNFPIRLGPLMIICHYF